jgi:hypothetical protein
VIEKKVFANFYHEKTGRETILNHNPIGQWIAHAKILFFKLMDNNLTIWISVSRQGKFVPFEKKLQL